MKTLSLDYLIFSETKINESFATAQFNVEGYEIKVRRDCDKYGGCLKKFVQRGFYMQRIKRFRA